MKCTLAELRYKEVIDIVDGSRYGFVGDVELDMESGTVKALSSQAACGGLGCWAGRRT